MRALRGPFLRATGRSGALPTSASARHGPELVELGHVSGLAPDEPQRRVNPRHQIRDSIVRECIQNRLLAPEGPGLYSAGGRDIAKNP